MSSCQRMGQGQPGERRTYPLTGHHLIIRAEQAEQWIVMVWRVNLPRSVVPTENLEGTASNNKGLGEKGKWISCIEELMASICRPPTNAFVRRRTHRQGCFVGPRVFEDHLFH